MQFEPPLDPGSRIGDLYFNASGQSAAYFTDVIHNRATIYAFWAILSGAEGGNSSIDPIAYAFRENRSVSGNLWTKKRKYRRSDTYPYYQETYEFEGVEYFSNLYLPVDKRGSYEPDRVRITRRLHEMAMYPEASHAGSKANEFVLILPWEWSFDRQRNHILGELNERLNSISMPRSWLEPVWDHLVTNGYIVQYESFGRFIGFNVQLYETLIQKFITKELRARTLFFPGFEPRTHVVPQEQLAIAD